MFAVRLETVTKRYGAHTAVADLDLAVPQGSLYGFIGPNGSGKTTTIRMILRILQPDAGTIELLGQRAPATAAANDAVGYLPEERGLYKKMSVRRMLEYYASLKGMPRAASHATMLEWLERFDLLPWANKKVESLSKGMSQKVQFIASAMAKPQLLILDEPFSGLDPVNTEVIRDAVLDMQQQGTTIIFSTHDMNTAENLCNFIFMIDRGKKVLDGTLADIKAQYGNDTLRIRWDGDRAFLASLNGVERVRDLGEMQELQVHGDPQAVLRQLVDRGNVQHFEIAQPSLHDIFMRIAQSPDPQPEMHHA